MAQNRKAQITSILIAFSSFAMIGLPGGFLGVAWPTMQQQYHQPIDAIGQQIFVSTIFYTLACFLSSTIIARIGIVNQLLAASVITAAGLTGMALAPSWLSFVLISALTGYGLGTLDSSYNIYMAGRISPAVMNWLHACFGVGATAGPFIMTLILKSELHWQGGFAGLAIFQGLLMLMVFATRKNLLPTSQALDEPRANQAGYTLRSALAVPLVWICLAVFFFYTGSEVTTGQWVYSLFTLARNIDTTTAGLWTGIFWGAFTGGRVLLGLAVERIGLFWFERICIMLSVVGAVLLWWNPTTVVSFLGLALVGFAFGPIFPTLVSYTPALFGEGLASPVISLEIGTASLGIAVLPWLAGILAKYQGLEVVGPYIFAANMLLWLSFELLAARSKSTTAV
jgi:fucose permease